MKRIISLFLVLALVLCACGKKNETAAWQEQYDLGVRYLTEGNYEEAILAFEAAIEIDPKQADAYIALAEVYTEQGDIEKAAEILARAIAEIGETDELTAARETLVPASDSAQEPAPETSADLSRTEREDYEEGTYVIREYNANGNLIRESWYWANDVMWYIDEYDVFGNRVSQTHYRDDGTMDYRYIWEYHTNGNLKSEVCYRDDGEWTTEYNTDGNPVRETRCDLEGTIWAYTDWEYNADGNLVRQIEKNGGWHRMDEYDTNGNMIRRTYYNSGGSEESVFEYDADGNVTARYDY